MKKILLLLFVISLAAAVPVFMLSCGIGGGGAGGGFANDGTSPGSVALYVTDDLGSYKQVRVTISDIRLEHIGSGAACDVLENPVYLDLTDLSSVLQLLDVTTCPSINYNRVIIEIDKQTVLTDSGNVSGDCNLATYKNEEGGTNTLICGDTCSINISGAVNVLASKTSNVTLDFDLKEFEVNDFNQPFCSVTMKVSPLSASDFDARHNEGDKEGITGFISDLNATDKSFTLAADGGTFTVTYDDVSAPGIDDLLDLAETEHLKVRVETSIINLDTLTIAATALYVELDGTVSDLDTVAKTFTLTYQTNKTIPVDYQAADVEGSLSGNSDVEVKLNGFDGTWCISTEVEVK